MENEKQIAYESGWSDYLNGIPDNQCPYVEMFLFDEWIQGWYDAKIDQHEWDHFNEFHPSQKDVDSAYQRGLEAFDERLRRDQCPYTPTSPLGEAWLTGWDVSHDDARMR